MHFVFVFFIIFTCLSSLSLHCLTLSSILQVSKALRVLPGHLVQEQLRETEVIQDSQVSQDPLAERENQDSLEDLVFLEALVLKVKCSSYV